MRLAEAAALALLCALVLPGCLYLHGRGSFGSYIDPAVVSAIEPGRTTKRDVLRLLGPPEEFIRPEVLWALADDATRVSGAIDLGNRAQDAFTYQRDTFRGTSNLLVFYNRVRSRVESEVLIIFFDEEDRVRELGFRRVEGER